MGTGSKKCRICQKTKPLGDFPRDRSKKDGHASRCRTCDRLKSARQYAIHKDTRLDAAKERQAKARVGKVRLCKCGAPTTNNRTPYCDACRPARRHRKIAKTKARGYGSAHRKAREKVAKEVEAGSAFCSRCGGWIEPGSEWHLDHSEDRATYLGPAHAVCNSTAPHISKPQVARATSRDW